MRQTCLAAFLCLGVFGSATIHAEEPIQLKEPQASFGEDLYREAQKKFSAQDWTGAITAIASYIDKARREATEYSEQAAAKRSQGLLETADEYSASSLTNALCVTKGCYFRARAFAARQAPGDAETAISDYNAVLGDRPTEAPATKSKGPDKSGPSIVIPTETLAACYGDRCYVEILTGRYVEALADANQALTFRPNNSLWLSYRAKSLECLGRFPEAYQDYMKCAKLSSEKCVALVYASHVAFLQSDLAKALETVEQASNTMPKLDIVSRERALIRLARHEFAEAAVDFDVYAEIVKSQGNTEDLVYTRFFGHLAHQALKRSSAGFPEFIDQLDAGWPKTLGLFLSGRLEENALFAAASQGEPDAVIWQQCNAFYFAGMQRLLHGEKANARDLFEKCKQTQLIQLAVFGLAQAELARLGS